MVSSLGGASRIAEECFVFTQMNLMLKVEKKQLSRSLQWSVVYTVLFMNIQKEL